MIDKRWVDKVNEIRSDCASCGVPIDVGVDKTPYGIDARLELGAIEMEESGDTYDIEFYVNIILSVQEDKWETLLERLQILTEKMTTTNRYMFGGWSREENESNLVYNGEIYIKGRVNNGLLS